MTSETHVIAVWKAGLFHVLFNAIKLESYNIRFEAVCAVSYTTMSCNQMEMFKCIVEMEILWNI